MGDVSTEFCGGTHVRNTSELGSFKIVSEESVGSGIRRITVKTKLESYNEFKTYQATLEKIADMLKMKSIVGLEDKVLALLAEKDEIVKENNKLNEKLRNAEADSLLNNFKDASKFKYLITTAEPTVNLKDFAGSLRAKVANSVIFIASKTDEKYTFVCAVDPSITDTIKAGDVVKFAASLADGKGGGKPDMAMAGGKNSGNLETILNEVENFITK